MTGTSRYACPMRCIICPATTSARIPLCNACIKDLPWHHHPHIGFYYKPPIDHWITQLKFHYRLHYGQLLGALLTRKWLKVANAVDLIMPIPLSRRRLFQRGFNQSSILCRNISQRTGIPIHQKHLKRLRHTQRQTSLNEYQRTQNLKHAFYCKPFHSPCHIALVDDVITTGSTIQAAQAAIPSTCAITVWACAKSTSH